MWRAASVKRQAPHLVVKGSGTEANREAASVHCSLVPVTVTWSDDNKQEIDRIRHNKGRNRTVHSHMKALSKESFALKNTLLHFFLSDTLDLFLLIE